MHGAAYNIELLAPYLPPDLAPAGAQAARPPGAHNKAQYLPERRKIMQVWADYLDGLRDGKVEAGCPRGDERAGANAA